MKKLTDESKARVFYSDLVTIRNPEIREFTKDVLADLPWYFWVQPASTTGQYHPACTVCDSGLLVHTKRVIFFGTNLISAHKLQDTEMADILMAAFILHDGRKGGKGYGSYEDYENHPVLVEERWYKAHPPSIDPATREPKVPKTWQSQIFDVIKHHMGPWTPEGVRKPLLQYNEAEIIMYHADYMASRKNVTTIADNVLLNLDLHYEEEEEQE